MAFGPRTSHSVRLASVRLAASLLLLSTISACSSGRTAPAAPTPATARPVGVPAAPRAMTLPSLAGYDLALSRGTRSPTGAPGPRYWQQWADYKLEAELNPVSKRLTGKGAITYYNRSPDTRGTV